MVVFKSWGRHERDSYVLYLRFLTTLFPFRS
jgi:hypothetical protein